MDAVGITTSDANAVPPTGAPLASGTKTFSVTLKTAGSITVTASDTTNPAIQQSTTPSITISAGTFTKLQLLVPGETAAPGTASGKAGAPMAQTAGTAFNLTVNAVDANWNVATSVTHTVGITCSDTNANLPANMALVSGTKIFGLTF